MGFPMNRKHASGPSGPEGNRLTEVRRELVEARDEIERTRRELEAVRREFADRLRERELEVLGRLRSRIRELSRHTIYNANDQPVVMVHADDIDDALR